MTKRLLSTTELRSVIPLVCATFCRMFGLFLLLPVIAPYVLGLPNGNLRLAGLAVGVYGLTQAAMLAPLGWLSDRVGRRPVLVCGMLVYALGGYLAGSLEHPAVVVLGRALQGMGAISAVVLAALSECTAKHTRAQAMALLGMGIGMAFGLALIVAGPLAAWLGVGGLLRITAWLGLLGAVAVLFAPLPKTSQRPGTLSNLLDVRLLPLCAGVLVIHLALAAIFVRIPLRLAELIDYSRLWQVYLTAFVLGLALAVPLLIRYSQTKLLPVIAGMAIACAAAGLIAAGQLEVLALTALLTLFFAGFNFLEAVLPVRASLLALPGARGATMGLYAIAQALGVFSGSFLVGAVGYNEASLVIVSVLTAVWSGVFFYFNSNKT